jgi:hypothetical protein
VKVLKGYWNRPKKMQYVHFLTAYVFYSYMEIISADSGHINDVKRFTRGRILMHQSEIRLEKLL